MTEPTETIKTWCGRDIRSLSAEELIEALDDAFEEIATLRGMNERLIRMAAVVAESVRRQGAA